MSPIQWKEHAKSGEETSDNTTDPWFGFAMVLVGLIAGYIVASFY